MNRISGIEEQSKLFRLLSTSRKTEMAVARLRAELQCRNFGSRPNTYAEIITLGWGKVRFSLVKHGGLTEFLHGKPDDALAMTFSSIRTILLRSLENLENSTLTVIVPQKWIPWMFNFDKELEYDPPYYAAKVKETILHISYLRDLLAAKGVKVWFDSVCRINSGTIEYACWRLAKLGMPIRGMKTKRCGVKALLEALPEGTEIVRFEGVLKDERIGKNLLGLGNIRREENFQLQGAGSSSQKNKV